MKIEKMQAGLSPKKQGHKSWITILRDWLGFFLTLAGFMLSLAGLGLDGTCTEEQLGSGKHKADNSYVLIIIQVKAESGDISLPMNGEILGPGAAECKRLYFEVTMKLQDE